MTEYDIDPFFLLLDETFEALGKTPAAKLISENTKFIFFRACAEHSLDDVRAALDHHCRTGTYTPVPNDINSFIESRRPALWVDANEAWAQVPKLESDAGILNQVTAAALAVAQPLIDDGDMIGARVAFIKAYDARVAKAKVDPDPAQRIPKAWVSGGNQPQRYQDPHGERQMLLEQGRAAGLLPAPKNPEPAPQLGNSTPPPGAMEALRGFSLKSLPPPEAE